MNICSQKVNGGLIWKLVIEKMKNGMVEMDKELANGGYEGLSQEQKNKKLKKDFDAFLRRRAEIVQKAVKILVEVAN